MEQSDYLGSVEWETLLFFAGLFIMVGALVKTGVVGDIARWPIEVTGGDPLSATMLILGVSAVAVRHHRQHSLRRDYDTR